MTNPFNKSIHTFFRMRNASNLGFVILFIVGLGCSCPKLSELANKSASTPSSSPIPGNRAVSTPTVKSGDYDLTMNKYNQLSIGTPRSEVESILGGKGTEVSSSKGGGVRFSVNKWEGDNYKSIILSFRNDKILTKSQFGLK